MSALGAALGSVFEPVFYPDFYSSIFDDSLSHQELATPGMLKQGSYVGIASRIITFSDNTVTSHNTFLYDGLDDIKSLVDTDLDRFPNEVRRLTIISPVSYAGRRRTSDNSRFLYALCVEIDGLVVKNGVQTGLNELLYQIDQEKLPRPTFIVSSGSGLHLYYKFVKPIPCFKRVKKSLWRFKRRLTKMLWNRYVTIYNTEEKIQYESVFQGFRMVGTQTKSGDICEAFATGTAVTIDYMNSFVGAKHHIIEIYKSELTKAQAKKLYPEWYQKRIINKDQSKGHWNIQAYDWWLNRIQNEAIVGHRYYCLMCLSIYAIKSNIPFERLKNDAYSLYHQYEQMTTEETNHFKLEDVEAALDIYRNRGDDLYTYPINYIEKHSGLEIKRNKRNGRTQAQHLIIARGQKALRASIGEDVLGGRPSKQDIILKWQNEHPAGTKAECIRDTGISKPTVYKWWNKGVE